MLHLSNQVRQPGGITRRSATFVLFAMLALVCAGCELPEQAETDFARSDVTTSGNGPGKKPDHPRKGDDRRSDRRQANRSGSDGKGGAGGSSGDSTEHAPPGAIVTDVVDGDTIEVDRGDRIVDVRLIGVDTPETVHPTEPVECFGPRASAFTSDYLEGEAVRLEFDIERRDQYGRTLAYVWIGGKLFNRLLVARGFATVSTYPPNTEHLGAFEAAESTARAHDRGLWGRCGRGGTGAGGGGGSNPGGEATRGKQCDPNYSGACVPEYPPDVDCDDVSATGFRSTGSDPHGFDGDGDGVACE